MSDQIHDLILTRPVPRSKEFVAELPLSISKRVRVHFAPLLEIEPVGPAPDLTGMAGVIFSSASGAALTHDNCGLPAYCVGDRTAREARLSGFEAQKSGVDADDLVASLIAQDVRGPLLHLHGKHTRGDIAKRLSSAGIETLSIVIYQQTALRLSDELLDIIQHSSHPIIPLFSPRTTQLFLDQVRNIPHSATMIAMSSAVADVLRPTWQGKLQIAQAPTAAAMIQEIAKVISG